MNKVFHLILLLFIISSALAQDNISFYSQRVLRTQNKIYNPDIKTVLLYPSGFPLEMPVIPLNSDKTLYLQFDDLEEGIKAYQYTFIHCNASWEPSELRMNEYMDGFNSDEIRDYKFSFNTTTSYVHYSLTFPNDRIRLSKSGNYILVVYLETPSQPQFTMRFMIYEPRVIIQNVKIGRAHLPAYMNTKQEVDFAIRPVKYQMAVPDRDLTVIILQNWRWDNALTIKQPRNITAEWLDYDYEEENLFDAGNQYRSVDIKSLRYRSEYIADIIYLADGYHVMMRPDPIKSNKPFVNDPDLNGRMYIKTEDMEYSETEADYAMVHFSLPLNYPLANGSIFILGGLTGNTLQPEAKMTYNYESMRYEGQLLLKQGYYNYLYVVANNDSDVGDTSFIEGNFWETDNEYTILVYHREPGEIYDKLIGLYQSGNEISTKQ